MNRRTFLKGTLISAVAACIPVSVKAVAAKIISKTKANYYYVDSSGSSASQNGSITKPFDSIREALDVVEAGDTIYVSSPHSETMQEPILIECDKPVVIIGYD